MQSIDQNRLLQFICKATDGKLVQVDPKKLYRMSTGAQASTTADSSGSNSDEPYKFVKMAQQKSSDSEGTETLPKFQQAFGKTVYQNVDSNSSVSTDNVSGDTVDGESKVAKTISSTMPPVQGSVIYTRQVPVGQTINLIPPGRGQVFRIATSNSDHTVIQSKMSALLAAALQGKPKTEVDGETPTDDSNARTQGSQIVKPVLQVPANTRNNPQPNLSSTTLEQLREFDMVYKQVKERSSTSTGAETSTSSDPGDGQRMNVTYVSQGQKFTQISPVVVVSSYCNLQPAASPALSVTSQGSSSPCVTPAPTPTLPKGSSKSSKAKTMKNSTTHASKASPIPKPQQKPQEDEHTTQRIFDILAEYAEQLRNSPDLNNKPAPRRRSNPPTNPNQSSKRKKNNSAKKSGQCSSTISSDADVEDPRTMGSEDSSCGVVQISMQEEEQTPTTTTQTTDASDSSAASCPPVILTEPSHNQTRNVIIADSSVGEALKMPSTAVLVPGNYIMPVSMVKGGQQIAVVSGGSKILATVPARSGPNMLLFQSFLNQNRKSGIPTVKYSAIQPISGISSQNIASVSAQSPVILPPAVTLGQPISIKKLNEPNNTELLLAISQPPFPNQPSAENSNSNISGGNAETVKEQQPVSSQAPVATSVISQTVSSKDDQQTHEHSNLLGAQDANKGERYFLLVKVMGTVVLFSENA